MTTGGILIPAYNAQASIAAVVTAARAQLPVIVVDDGCSDGTAARARAAGGDVVAHDRNRGKGEALKTGFRRARDLGWTFCITMDADAQHDPRDLARFLQAHELQPVALILGKRLWHKMPIPSRFTRTLGLIFLTLGSGKLQSDSQCGYRLYPMEFLNRVNLQSPRYELESEVLLVAGRRRWPLRYIPIETIYYPGEKRSHFRPWPDTWRIIGTFFASLVPGWTRRRFSAAALLLCMTLLFACSKQTPLQTHWPKLDPTTHDVPAVIEALKARQQPLTSLRAEVSVEVRGIDPPQPSLSGELVMRKPGDIRLRTYSPLGPVAFDLLYTGTELQFYVPTRNEVVLVPIKELSNLVFGGNPVRVPLPENWWSTVEPLAPDAPTPSAAVLPVTDNPLKGQLVLPDRKYVFDWATGRIEKLLIQDRGSITYSDWKILDGYEFASQITVDTDAKATKPVTLILRLRSLKTNPEIPSHAFDAVDTRNLKVTRLATKTP